MRRYKNGRCYGQVRVEGCSLEVQKLRLFAFSVIAVINLIFR